jgi:hypothetical protein
MGRVLVKRFVQDAVPMSLRDLERYIEGKAREHQVSSSALLNAEDLLTNVHARIFEDDLLDTARRDESAGRIKLLLDQLDREPIDEIWLPPASEEALIERRQRWVAVLAATTALIGSLAALLPAIGGQLNGGAYLAAVGASLVVIWAAIAVVRLRYEDDPDQASDSALQGAARLERAVERIVKRYGGERLDGPDQGLDFLVERQGRRLGIELKAWNRPIPRANLGRAVKNAASAGKRTGVDEVLLVTPSPSPASTDGIGDGDVRVIGVDELAAVLKGRDQ